MISAISTALSGLLSATQKVDTAARNIAQGPSETNELIKDIVDIKIAKTEYKANIETIKVAEEMSDELLSIFDEEV